MSNKFKYALLFSFFSYGLSCFAGNDSEVDDYGMNSTAFSICCDGEPATGQDGKQLKYTFKVDDGNDLKSTRSTLYELIYPNAEINYDSDEYDGDKFGGDEHPAKRKDRRIQPLNA